VLLVITLVAAFIGASAVSASNDQSLTGSIFSFLGFNASSQSRLDDKSGVLPQPKDTPPDGDVTGGDIATRAEATDAVGACSVPVLGLRSWYRFENNYVDSVNAAPNGNPIGGPTFGPGTVGQGVVLSGANYVDIDTADNVLGPNASLDAWINYTTAPAVGTNGDVIAKWDGSAANSSYVLGIANIGGLVVPTAAIYQTNGTFLSSTAPLLMS